MTPHLSDNPTPSEVASLEEWFRGFVPASLSLPPDRAYARGVTIRNRQLWMAARRDHATADVDGLYPYLAGVERARVTRRHARALVAAGDEIALGWIRRARRGR